MPPRPPRYIRHLTIDTGHQRDSYRDEVADDIVAMLQPLLDRAARGEHVPIPGDIEPACTMTGGVGRDRALLLTICAVVAHLPILQIGVAPSSLASAAIWREWFGCARDDRTPAAPWCCVRIMPAMAVYPSAAAWLGDFERCAAWAWLQSPDCAEPGPTDFHG